MTLRQRLKAADGNEAEIINSLDPETISINDLLTLLRIKRARATDPLVYLGLEAKWWLQDHKDVVKARLNQERDRLRTQGRKNDPKP